MNFNDIINEISAEEYKLPQKGSRARTRFESGHEDYRILLGRYKTKAKALRDDPKDFSDEMIERFPIFGEKQDKQKDEVKATYERFAKELADFYEWKADHPKINLETAFKIYNWRTSLAPQYISSIKKYVKDSLKEIEKGKA